MEKVKRLLSNLLLDDSYPIPQYIEAYITSYRNIHGNPHLISVAENMDSGIKKEYSATCDAKPVEPQLVGA